jgi:prolyl 4-hydroxylase
MHTHTHVVTGPRRPARALHSKLWVRLVAVGFITLIGLVILIRPPHRDTGDSGARGAVREGRLFSAQDASIPMRGDGGIPKRLLQEGPPEFRPLVNGTDYFADYDIWNVKMDPEPEIGENEKRYFSYIKPEEHPEYAMRYVSNHPRVLLIQDLLTPQECDEMMAAVESKLNRSKVAIGLNSKTGPVNEVRTSTQAWLDPKELPAKPVVDRLLELTGFEPGAHELLQVLHYGIGQKYDAHTDYFPPSKYGPQTTNRAITVFLYLNDVEEGGETQFPRADGKPPTFDLSSCTHGLRVHPRKGQAALFYDMQPNGKLDPYSLHGGCPVKQGVKWGGTLWLRVPTGGT